MTKKLEEFLNIAADAPEPMPLDAEVNDGVEESTPEQVEEAKQSVAVNTNTIQQVDQAIDKIDTALPTVRDLAASDQEMDELAALAKEKFEDLMDLGMNVEPRFSGVILQTASTLLGHAITAKTAKMDKKLKMIQLQLQQARLEHQIKKDQANADEDGETITAQGMVIDRDTLLKQILDANKKD